MRALLSFFVLISIASAQDMKAWKKVQSGLDREERVFWKEFKSRFNDALNQFELPVNEARDKPEENKEAVYDFAGINRLNAAAEDFGIRRGQADIALGAADPKAAAALLKALTSVTKSMDKLDKDLMESRPDFSRYVFDQERGCRLLALDARRTALIQALASAPAEFLSKTAWKKVSKTDGKHSATARTAVIAACRDASLVPFLQERLADKTTAVRVAAAKTLALTETKGAAALADKVGAVRRALLLAIPEENAAAWFAPVLTHAASARGYERALCIDILTRISGQKFGFDLTAWQKWHEVYAKELASGKFDVKTVEVADVKPAPDPDAFPFYGESVPSIGAVFVLEGSRHMAMPADVDVQRTKWRDEWKGQRQKWEDEHPAHQTIVLRQVEAALGAAADEFRWGALLLHGAFTINVVGEKKLLDTKSGSIAKVRKLIERSPAKGWCSPYTGMREAALLGGDTIDTVVFWGTGDPSGGRFMGGHNAAQAWTRFNRYRKLQVVGIRISNRKTEAEAFLKAVSTRYRWAKKPPA